MKIYQIHEYGGEWEDKYDCIVGSYLSKEKVMKEHMRLEKEQEDFIKQAKKCSKCPLYDRSKNINDVGKYCDDYEVFEEGVHDPYEYDESDLCVNHVYDSSYWNDTYYRVEEIEVIE